MNISVIVSYCYSYHQFVHLISNLFLYKKSQAIEFKWVLIGFLVKHDCHSDHMQEDQVSFSEQWAIHSIKAELFNFWVARGYTGRESPETPVVAAAMRGTALGPGAWGAQVNPAGANFFQKQKCLWSQAYPQHLPTDFMGVWGICMVRHSEKLRE